MRPLLSLLCLAVLAGCATSRATFREVLADGSSTEFETTVRATLGSRLQEGAGDMDYTGADWRLRVGQSATGLQAGGDPVELLRELTASVRVLAPFLQQPAAPPEPASPAPVVLDLPPGPYP
jgi:hypothetical protein